MNDKFGDGQTTFLSGDRARLVVVAFCFLPSPHRIWKSENSSP